ncbi:Acetoacetyl-CoA synthetase [hydrothermal vent metagenome]|uniref:Acetoacetyl-CoA synthetase n=1 Tax=hydrothermal vent metagenome TaxID=652676 RepID=A0A3B0TPX1_9ZZZZ
MITAKKTSKTGEIIWQPSMESIQASNIYNFAKSVGKAHQSGAKTYQNLLDWSLQTPEDFYQALWDQLDIIGDSGAIAFERAPSLAQCRFFPDAKLNYAENLLRDPDDRLALIAHRDDGTRRSVTRKQLHQYVSRIVQALRAEGVGVGDRIAAIVTNDIEAIAFYLASAAIGAIWASCSPDFGPQGAADRLNQLAPKLLVAVPSYRYGDKYIQITETINAVAAVPSLEKIILFGPPPQDAQYIKPALEISAWIAPFSSGDISFHHGGFNDAMVILFSSGTTGKPKCIIHRAGGLLVQHKKEQALNCDIKPGDRLFYYSTCGWMMWNWQISALSLGATLVTYDGNPFFPQPERLVDMIDSDRITHFGTSAKYIDACSKAGLKPKNSHDLSSLKAVLSTGSPLLPESFDYIYDSWKSDLHLASISGGTDICACFVGGVPVLPVRRGELQGAMLGMDLDTLDENGQPVSGQPGEFVCRSAHMSMPIGFWHDEDGVRYHNAYFSRFAGLWAQGDYVEKRPRGGFIIHGRSDTTLNPGGVRIGTAEIYRQVETIPEIIEAIAVGLEKNGDQEVILFVRLKDGVKLDDELVQLVRSRIRKGATPRHVPSRIVAVPDIPRTRSGKISEIAVRDVIHGRKVKNTTALANAACLEFYAGWAKQALR